MNITNKDLKKVKNMKCKITVGSTEKNMKNKSPSVDKKWTLPEVLPMAREYYSKDDNGVGGTLHIVLEDGNVKDDDVEFCIKLAIEKGDKDGEKLGKILLTMSKTQRTKLCTSI